MEKIEKKSATEGVGQWKGRGGIYYEYRFTPDEKKSLQNELKKFRPENVKIFIYRLQDQCQHALRIMTIPGRTDHKEKLKYLLKIFKPALFCLRDLEQGRPLLEYKRSVSTLPQLHWDTEIQDILITGLKLSSDAAEPLSALIETIDKQLKKEKSRPRKRPESYSKGLIEVISKIFEQSFHKKPSTYDAGIFTKVVKIALEAVGLPAKDPGRIIKQILKNK